MTSIPGAEIVTMHSPVAYSREQIDEACTIAASLNRGQLALIVEPDNDCPESCGLCSWLKDQQD